MVAENEVDARRGMMEENHKSLMTDCKCAKTNVKTCLIVHGDAVRLMVGYKIL